MSRDVPIPSAPFYGSRVVENISLADLFSFINETALFKGQWQFKQGRTPLEEYQALVRQKVRPIYQELKERSVREKLLDPKLVYGYFQCQSEGNDLIVYDEGKEVRFTFPRQPAGKHLCLADFFAAKDSGKDGRRRVSSRHRRTSSKRVLARVVQVRQLLRLSLFPRFEC